MADSLLERVKMTTQLQQKISQKEVTIHTAKTQIKGDLSVPQNCKGIIIFAHGAGSSRFSLRNKHVAQILQNSGFATLLMDLLSENEDQIDRYTRKLRFDIPLLAGRVNTATEWILNNPKFENLQIGYFGASTGAAAALVASMQKPGSIAAIVSRGGRPDLAQRVLKEVRPPTLLIVGSNDTQVIELNRMALKKLKCKSEMVIIPGASHLFEESGKLDEVADHARKWFEENLISKKR